MSPQKRDEELIERCLEIVGIVKPDIIHVFGTETPFGLIAEKTDIPVVVHLQGIISPCSLSFLPPGMSWHIASKGQKQLFWEKRQRRAWYLSSKREQRVFKCVKYFTGRTHWDHILANVLSPNAKYYYVSEILRDAFYVPSKRELPKKLKIISTISFFPYKGFDNVLKTAKVITDFFNIDFEWHVFGNVNGSPATTITGIKPEDVHVVLRGIADENTIKTELLSSTLYYHPSYIDNSPNSVCEAQILGVPVIAQNVGGVASLIKHEETGFLVPANDAFQSAYWIKWLYDHKEANIIIGDNCRSMALDRHDKVKTSTQLIDCYKDILG